MHPMPKRFIMIWVGQMIAEVAGSASYFALGLWVLEESGSSLSFAITLIAGLLPGILLGPLLAPMVDRRGANAILVATTLALAAVGTTALLLLATGSLTVTFVIAIIAVESVIETVHSLGFSRLVGTLPDRHIDRATGMMSIIDPVAGIIGPATGAALFATIGLTPLLLADIAGYLVAAVTVLIAAHLWGRHDSRVDEPGWQGHALATVEKVSADPSGIHSHSSAEPKVKFSEQLRDGLRIVWQDAVLRRLVILYASLNFTLGAAAVLIIPTLLLKSNGDTFTVGMLQSVTGIAGVVGGLAATWLLPRLSSIGVIIGGIILSSLLGPLVTALGTDIPMWVIGAWGAAFFYPAIGAAYQALWLRSVPRDQIARVVSLRELLTMVTGPLGMALAPLVATHFAPLALTWPPLSAAFGAGATGAHALTLAVAALLVVIIAVVAAPRLVRAASSKSRIEATLGD